MASLNRHGDLAALVDGAGTLVASRVYEPFGVVAGSGGTANPGVGYQADVTDPDTGDVWMGARWYDPADAQFTARDTVFGQLATPVTLNRYTYANGNPLTFHDPTGRCSRHTIADIQAEQNEDWRGVMAFTARQECMAAGSQAFTPRFDNVRDLVLDTTGISDVVECVQGDAASCGMAALNVIPGGRAAKAISQTLVRFKRSAKAVKQVKKQLNRVQTAARSATSRIKHGPDVPPTAKTPAHIPNASNARKAPNAPQSPGARQAAALDTDAPDTDAPSARPTAPATTKSAPAVRDFAHGTSAQHADSITKNGLDESAARTNASRGQYARPGAFHTFEVTPYHDEGLQLAYEMGLRHAPPCAVLICSLPASTVDELMDARLVRIEPIPGVDVPQVVFEPEAFPRINRDATWTLLSPGG